jgi:hypothetical protein
MNTTKVTVITSKHGTTIRLEPRPGGGGYVARVDHLSDDTITPEEREDMIRHFAACGWKVTEES